MVPRLPKQCSAVLEQYLRPELFQALCDPQRLTLLGRLAVCGEGMTVSEASGCCGVHLSGVSRHLGLLKRAGIVTAEKRGRETHYRVNAEPLIATLRGLADALERCCPPGQP